MEEKLATVFQKFWYLSIATFVLSFLGIQIYKNDLVSYTQVSNVWIVAVASGILSYLLYFFFKASSKKNKRTTVKKLIIQGIAALIFCVVVMPVGAKGVEFIQKPTPTPSLSPQPYSLVTPSPIPSATIIPTRETATVNPDPLIGCVMTPECGGKTIQLHKSQCDTWICCQIGNSWSLYPSRDSCTSAQNSRFNNYPSCTVYYPGLGYSQTYNNVSASQCALWQQQANSSTSTLNFEPPPSIEPYQYSQEYLNSINNFNNVINTNWTPQPFVAPTPYCYPTWDAYFAAHPTNSYNNIAGVGSPPCE